jgi:hypothetical protein
LETAWEILQNSVFNGLHEVAPAFTAPPSLHLAGNLPYDNQKLMHAWKLFLDAAPVAAKSDTFEYDLVSVTRQTLANYSADLHQQALKAYRAKDRSAVQTAKRGMLELISDLDRLLATRSEYLLGNWRENARRWGATGSEKDRLEWNARRVITMWGETTAIRDYSRRQWSGMLTGFYLQRWQKFFQALDDALASGKAFDQKTFDLALQEWERRWADQHESYRTRPRGNVLSISRQLWEKYQPVLAKSSAPDAPSLTTAKPATSSSALPGFPAFLANDGQTRNTDSYWATDIANDKDPWWQVDFQTPTTVGRVVVIGYFGDERYYGFLVETSNDGQTWETAADWRNNKEPSTDEGYTCRFTPRTVRYLRIRQTFNSRNTGRHLVEVLAFEK